MYGVLVTICAGNGCDQDGEVRDSNVSSLRPSSQVYSALGVNQPTAIPGINKAQLIDDVRKVS